jgi:hypothetical protein
MTGMFYAQRDTDPRTGNVTSYVIVRPSKGSPDSNEVWICRLAFRKVFGFTPRKGKKYQITIESQVEEV